jgi:hypothetical protein
MLEELMAGWAHRQPCIAAGPAAPVTYKPLRGVTAHGRA